MKNKRVLWEDFSRSGSIYDYLKFKSAVRGDEPDIGDITSAVYSRGDEFFLGKSGDTHNGADTQRDEGR